VVYFIFDTFFVRVTDSNGLI